MMMVSRMMLIVALVTSSVVVGMESEHREITIQNVLDTLRKPYHQRSLNDIQLVTLYLHCGGNINAKGTVPVGSFGQKISGMTLLMTSILCSRPGLMRFLINRYARLDYQNECGDTALHIAAKTGHADMARTLQVSGANKNIRNNENRTALDEAYYSPLRYHPFYNQKKLKNFYFPRMIRRLEAPDKEKACSQLRMTQY